MDFTRELKDLKTFIDVRDAEEEDYLIGWIMLFGYKKCIEMRNNYLRVLGDSQEKVPFSYLLAFSEYEYLLADILFSLLRIQEDAVKAYLSNLNIGKKVNVESRPSNYSKTKNYFLFPVSKGDHNSRYLHIRTNYTRGPVDYYEAIRSLDFGDVNLLFSHLSSSQIEKFSNNPEIINDLDRTRKLRNYVYHHNLLYSMDTERLKHSIVLLIKNVPSSLIRKQYIDLINKLPYEDCGSDYDEIAEKIAIHIGKTDIEEINRIKPAIG